MTRTGQAAIDYARSRIGPNSMPDSGLCLQFVRTCFDVGSYYASAIDAWNGATDRREGDRNPPQAVPLWFASPSIYDHVVFCCSPSEIISTFNADVRSYGSISEIERVFDASYLGWAPNINTVTIWTPDSSGGGVPVPIGEDDEEMKLIRVSQDGRIFLVTSTLFQQVGDMVTANALAALYGTWTDMDVAQADAIHNQVNANIVATVDNLQGQIDS